jgi:hypothetical protein
VSVLFGEYRADQVQHCLVVQKDADDVGALLDLLVHPLERVGGPDLVPVVLREDGVGCLVGLRVREHADGFRQRASWPSPRREAH